MYGIPLTVSESVCFCTLLAAREVDKIRFLLTHTCLRNPLKEDVVMCVHPLMLHVCVVNVLVARLVYTDTRLRFLFLASCLHLELMVAGQRGSAQYL